MGVFDFIKKIRNIRLLPPRDKKFYDLFGRMSQTLVVASEELIKLFEAPYGERGVISLRIETCHNESTDLGKRIEDLLRTSPQPPFDRSGISQFSNRALRVMKYINHAANRYVIYEFPSSDKEMRDLAPLILEACRHIHEAVDSLQTNRNIEPYLRKIEALETAADGIYHGGLRRRFHEIREDRTDLEAKIRQTSGQVTAAELLPILSANVEYTRHVAIFLILRQVYAEMERAIDSCSETVAILSRMVGENV